MHFTKKADIWQGWSGRRLDLTEFRGGFLSHKWFYGAPMHASSLENMRICYRRFVEGSWLGSADHVTVLDFGGADVNGSYRDIFEGPQFDYVVADIASGDGVTVLLEDPYTLPFDEASIDIVISGQALEHCEFFWLAFAEMARVLKPAGFIFLIVPSAGPVHRFPVDCYRFHPDAYRALAKYADCRLIDTWCDERGPWNDLVGVFQRGDAPELSASHRTPAASAGLGVVDFHGSAEEEAISGDASYLDVLAEIHHHLAPSFYLEIGVRHGKSLALAQGPAVGVDPSPEIQIDLSSTTSVASMTSDDFFAGPHRQWLRNGPDFAFIDGMHLFEYALRDFMHVERAAASGALLIFDDIFPCHQAQAARTRRTRVWTGDVWKLHECLREYRSDLFLFPIDASPTGLLLVGGLDSRNRVLWDHYNPIVRAYTEKHRDPPPEILSRIGTNSGKSPFLPTICAIMREARESNLSTPRLVERLRAALGEGDVIQAR